MKRCSKCKASKPLNAFYRRNSARDGRASHCKVCKYISLCSWRKRNKKRFYDYLKGHYRKSLASGQYKKRASTQSDALIRYRLKSRYGLLKEDRDLLLAMQGDRCAICKSPLNGKFHVDHDHKANYIRGLLCRQCNQGIGLFRDSVTFLVRASSYIQTSFPLLQMRRAL